MGFVSGVVSHSLHFRDCRAREADEGRIPRSNIVPLAPQSDALAPHEFLFPSDDPNETSFLMWRLPSRRPATSEGEFFMNFTRNSLRPLAAGAMAIAAMSAAPALSQTATSQFTFTGNTCGGAGGINNCYATTSGTVVQGDPGTAGSSPLIARFDANESGSIATTEVSTLFPSVTGTEFNIMYTGGATNSLTFGYTPGPNDPAIHYVGIFQANTYDLFYYASGISSGTFNLSTYFPNNPGFSHIDFYDTGAAVPEPVTWAMMLLGFAGIGWTMRRSRRKLALA
jgi:hypothetical protein